MNELNNASNFSSQHKLSSQWWLLSEMLVYKNHLSFAGNFYIGPSKDSFQDPEPLYIYIFLVATKTQQNVGRWWIKPMNPFTSVYVIFGCFFWGIPWVGGVEAGIALWAAAWPLLHGAGALAEGVSTLALGRCQRLQEVGWGWSVWKLPSSTGYFFVRFSGSDMPFGLEGRMHLNFKSSVIDSISSSTDSVLST